MQAMTIKKTFCIVLVILLFVVLFFHSYIQANDEGTKSMKEQMKNNSRKMINVRNKWSSNTSNTKLAQQNSQKSKPSFSNRDHTGEKYIKFSLCPGKKIKRTQKRKILSYSVFGDNAFQKYADDIRHVIKESTKIKTYKDWSLRLYHENIFPLKFMQQMKKINTNIDFCNINHLHHLYPNISMVNARVWRFLPMGDDTVDISCIRDVDSPLLSREGSAVKEWLQSGKILHVMRDNPMHLSNIMGGMWCFRNSKNRILGKKLMEAMLNRAERRSSMKEARKHNDQTLLNQIVWPELLEDVMQHDSFLCDMFDGSIPFPTQRKRYFVGCVRPCKPFKKTCPLECRPESHIDWKSC